MMDAEPGGWLRRGVGFFFADVSRKGPTYDGNPTDAWGIMNSHSQSLSGRIMTLWKMGLLGLGGRFSGECIRIPVQEASGLQEEVHALAFSGSCH